MIKYNVKLNNGVEALNINEKSISASEVVDVPYVQRKDGTSTPTPTPTSPLRCRP